MNEIEEIEKALHIEDIDRSFLLKVVQPALVGLIDGSISTLAPLFAAAFASGDTRITFLVGTAAAIGAAISMAFAEALSDTGVHTGRGHPIRRGFVTGLMTFLGGIVHTFPFLIPDLSVALYWAYAIVAIELIVIAYIRNKYFNMGFMLSSLQVIAGGIIVVLAGIFIGSE